MHPSFFRRLTQICRSEAYRRVNWFRVISSAPSTAQIGWHATLLGKRILLGEHAAIYDFAYLQVGLVDPEHEYIRIGNGSSILPYAQVHSWGGFVDIAEGCSINAYTILYGTGGIRVGSGVRIAAQTVVVASSHRFDAPDVPIREQGITAEGIVIEDDVWIGAGCRILDGVRIGRGAVVAAGAVVTRSVAPLDIVGGVPAKVIGQRGKDR